MPINVSDAELIYMFRKGSLEARQIIYEKYGRLVWKITNEVIRSYGIEISMRDDAVQEGRIAFENCLMNFDTTRNSGIANMLIVTLGHGIRNRLRRYIRKGNLCNRNALSFDSYVDDDENLTLYDVCGDTNHRYDPLVYYEVSEKKRMLNEVLDKYCNDAEREVVKLRRLGYPYREIAENTSLTVKQVDNTLQKVKRRVKSEGEKSLKKAQIA